MVQISVEKLTKYRGLQIEVDKMWQTPSRTVPVIIRALGSDLLTHLSAISLPRRMLATTQESVLLSTAQLLRRYLS